MRYDETDSDVDAIPNVSPHHGQARTSTAAGDAENQQRCQIVGTAADAAEE
jgi:hypothetical protein